MPVLYYKGRNLAMPVLYGPYLSDTGHAVLILSHTILWLTISTAGAAAVRGVLPRGRGGGRHAHAALLPRLHRLRHASAREPGKPLLKFEPSKAKALQSPAAESIRRI